MNNLRVKNLSLSTTVLGWTFSIISSNSLYFVNSEYVLFYMNLMTFHILVIYFFNTIFYVMSDDM